MAGKKVTSHPGYPWEGYFYDLDEIKEYFDHDRITCLLCGRQYANLGLHISKSHQLSHGEYKERYGLPWSYGLAGKAFRAKMSKTLKKTRKSGKIAKSPSKQHLKKLLAARMDRRTPVQAVKNECTRKILERHGLTEQWVDKDFEEFLKRIASGRTPAEVARDKDMPSRQAWQRYTASNPAFKKRFHKIWDSLPYSVQARAFQLGKKFKQDVIKLRRHGLSFPKIAEKLGVTHHSVRHAWYRLKEQGKLTKSDQKYDLQPYGPEVYEEYIRRIASGRKINEVGRDKDMPSTALFHRYLNSQPEFRKKFERMWDSLPYDQQARSRRLGMRFQNDVLRLRKKGYSWAEIAKNLGVSRDAARTQFYKHQGGNEKK